MCLLNVFSQYLHPSPHLLSVPDLSYKEYLTSFLDAANYIKSNRTRNNWSDEMIRELRSLVSRIDIEENKLINDSAIQEELMSQ